jgi:hypothetical protein
MPVRNRRLVADPAYVRFRSFADIRRGPRAVPWVDRLLGLAPVFFTQVTPRQYPLWVMSRPIRADKGMSALLPTADMLRVEIDVC